MTVFAFVVTYNRLELLKKTVEKLRCQTYGIDRLVVVNNASTDGTDVWLEQQHDLYVITQENLGGAGGFHAGVKYCFEQGADWIWMMDDDVFPQEDCLEILLKYKDKSGCLQPARYHRDLVPVEWGYVGKYPSFHLLERAELEKECCPVQTGCFEGMCIHRSVVEKIGYPDPRFFIAGDDTVYGFAAHFHTSILLIREARLVRASLSGEKKISPMYLYYTFRNFYLGEEYYNRFFCKKRYSTRIMLKYWLGILLTIIHFYCSRKTVPAVRHMAIYAVWRGYRDGRRGCCGRTFNL